MRRHLPSAVGFIAALTCFAAAAQVRKVAVMVVPAQDRQAGSATLLENAIVEGLATDARFELWNLSARSSSDESRDAAAKRAKLLLKEGTVAFENLEPQKALDAVTAATNAFPESDLRESFKSYVEALAMRAVILHSQDPAEASNELHRLLTVSASFAIDPARLTPELSQALESAREKLKAAGASSFEVQSDPAGALVYVDGELKGATPVEVSALAPGQHFVTLSLPGFELFQNRQLAGPGQLMLADLVPRDGARTALAARANLRAGFRQGVLSGAAEKTAAALGVEEVLAVVVGEGTSAPINAVRVHNGFAPVTADLAAPLKTTDGIESASAKIRALLDTELKASDGAQPVAAVQTEQVAAPTRSSRSLMYGTFIAGGVGAASAVTFGLLANGKAAEARATPATRQADYEASAASARSLALVSDVSTVIALAGLGTGLYLLLTEPAASSSPAEQPKSQEHDPFAFGVAPTASGASVTFHGGF